MTLRGKVAIVPASRRFQYLLIGSLTLLLT
jgi:hypothetical protein